jgi:hypothetical protein
LSIEVEAVRVSVNGRIEKLRTEIDFYLSFRGTAGRSISSTFKLKRVVVGETLASSGKALIKIVSVLPASARPGKLVQHSSRKLTADHLFSLLSFIVAFNDGALVRLMKRAE